MPSLPPRFCEHCRTIHTGYCPKKSQRREQQQQRGSAAERGYDYRWQKASKEFLQVNPLCRECSWYGVVEPAAVVDHSRPHKGDSDWFWRSEWWQGLCKRCHDRKSAREARAMAKWVICGPPGSGKTTWARSRAKPGDLVFDADDLIANLFGTPHKQMVQHGAAIVNLLRQTVVSWLLEYPDRHAYVIQTDERKARETAEVLQARLVIVDESHATREDLSCTS